MWVRIPLVTPIGENMKIIKYAVASKLGFEHFQTEIDQRKHMKELHNKGVQPVPCVLVEGLPGEPKSKWLELSKYKKICKEVENASSD